MWKFINDDKSLIRHSGIKISKTVTVDSFLKAIRDFCYRTEYNDEPGEFCLGDLITHLSRDNKTDFSPENCGLTHKADIGIYNMMFDKAEPLLRRDYIEIMKKDGYEIPYLEFWSGGDWEVPLYGYIYFNGTNLKLYIPSYGNSVDLEKRCAFGSESYDIPKDFQKKFDENSKYYRDENEYLIYYCYRFGDNDKLSADNYDSCAIYEDFKSRVEII